MDPKKINLVFFHNPCQDGLTSAWIANLFARENNLKFDFHGISNNNSPKIEPNIKNKNIIFIDYAPNKNQIITVKKKALDYFILDHHKTNEEYYKNHPNVHFDMEKSGAGLAWDYFFPNREVPLFVKMVQDRDLWKWEINNSKEFCSGLFYYTSSCENLEETFNMIDEIFVSETKFNEVINFGKILEKRKQNQINNILKNITKKTYDYNGKKICIVNADHELASDLGSAIVNNHDYDAAVMWRYDHLNEEYWLSLRANNKLDVSEICKSFGGGGHKNAAGCSVKEHPSILFNKPLR